MLSVPDAARRTGKNPETIRRWIRSGKLRADKIGTQHFVEEADLDEAAGTGPGALTHFPPRYRKMHDGRPMPDWVALIREHRDSR